MLADNGIIPNAIIQRYNADGTRDMSFSSDVDGDHHEATDIEAAGDKLFVGTAFHVVSSHMNESWLAGAHIFKLNADGSFDTSWGDNGYAFMPDTDGNDRGVVDMLLLSDGKLLALADTTVTDTGTGASWPHYSVARFNANGTIDTSFGGGDGVVHISSGGHGGRSVEMEIQPTTGEVVVLGTILFNTGEGLQLTRLNAAGSVDTSYGGTFEPFGGHPAAQPTRFALQSNGSASNRVRVRRVHR